MFCLTNYNSPSVFTFNISYRLTAAAAGEWYDIALEMTKADNIESKGN